MGHVNSVLLAISKTPNATVFQKTLAVNDFYFGEKDFPYPMGHISFVGKLDAIALSAGAPAIVPGMTLDQWQALARFLAHAGGLLIENRVTALNRDGEIVLTYTPTTWRPTTSWSNACSTRCSGRPSVLSMATTATSAFLRGIFCRPAHPIEVWRTRTAPSASGATPRPRRSTPTARRTTSTTSTRDGSFFPSSGAVNPALTIIANALRVGDHPLERLR
jgi:hypothetical protein